MSDPVNNTLPSTIGCIVGFALCSWTHSLAQHFWWTSNVYNHKYCESTAIKYFKRIKYT